MEPIFVVLGDMLDKMMENAVNRKDEEADGNDKSTKESQQSPIKQNSTDSADGAVEI